MDPQISFESEQYVTQEQFAAWCEKRMSDLERCELLNGRIVMNPPSGWPQGEAGLLVAARLLSFVRSAGLGRAFGADQGFELPSGDTVGPDAAFVSKERWAATGPHEPGKFLRLVPELVVEVLSPSTASHDRGEKKLIYENNGVAEYWLVDTRARRVTRFVLSESKYGIPRIFEEADTLESQVLLGLRIPVVELFP